MLAWAVGWQETIILLFVVLPPWVFGGGALLWVGGRFIVRAPKATYWRSVGAHTEAGMCWFAICGLLSGVCAAAFGPVGAVVGMLIGGIGGLLVVWAIVKAFLGTTYGQAILAWVPTIPANLGPAALGAAVIVLAIAQTGN